MTAPDGGAHPEPDLLPFGSGQIVTVFRSRRRAGCEAEYQRVAAEMQRAAREMPGFVDFKTFTAEDGEHVSLVTFASADTHGAWRDDLRHRQAQQEGRDEFYSGYSVQVGECVHASQWRRDES